MMGLAAAFSELDVNVTYVAERRISADRKQQGWLEPETGGVLVEIAEDDKAVSQLVAEAPNDSIHICQGIRANGLVGVAQKQLGSHGLTQWIVMETVRDVGWRGIIKRFEYARLFGKNRHAIAGVLATGYRTPQWIIQRGVPAKKVFSFAYFLEKNKSIEIELEPARPFRFIFVGQFIPRKRLEWLIKALGGLTNQDFELVVIGSGPLEGVLRAQAVRVLKDKVKWIGKLPSNEVRAYMTSADCLVLPSLYDGWGAVVSEALICGTPVICSDACGSAGVVAESGVGGVFQADDDGELKELARKALKGGRITQEQRGELILQSNGLTAEAGARYLLDILSMRFGDKEKPRPPWFGERACLVADT